MAAAELRDTDPRQVGTYTLTGRLGAGGMGVVYDGRTVDGARVAVKVLRADMADDPEFLARFRREIATLRRVGEVCRVPVLDADVGGDLPYVATAFVPGPTLAGHIQEHGPMAADDLRALGWALGRTFAAIHAIGVVHRDLKPGNIILAPDGPRVIDFGIAQLAEATALTHTGLRVGTPGYLSPEQILGDSGPAADVFAWGATLAHAGTGHLPFGSGHPDVVMYRVLHTDPDLSQLPDPVADVVRAALRKDAEQRPSAEELAQWLESGQRPDSVGDEVTLPPVDRPGAAIGPLARQPDSMDQLTTGTGGGAGDGAAASLGTPSGRGTAGDDAGAAGGAGRQRRTWTVVAAGIASAVIAGGAVLAVQLGNAGGSDNGDRAGGDQSDSRKTSGSEDGKHGTDDAGADGSSGDSSDPSEGGQRTETVNFQPWATATTLNSKIQVSKEDNVSCSQHSQVTQRSDAWVCRGGGKNSVYDPCFVPKKEPPGGRKTLVCPAPDASLPIQVVRVRTQEPVEAPGKQPGAKKLSYWWLEAHTKSHPVLNCHLFNGGARGTVHGKVPGYACGKGTYLYDEINRSKAQWSISYLPSGKKKFEKAKIFRAYQ